MAGVIDTVEQALVDEAKAALGSTVRKVETLGGAWTLDALRRALQTAPGVYVAFLGGQRGTATGYVNGRFGVYAVTKGPLEPGRRQGTPREIGAYDIIERLYSRIDGKTIAGVGSCQATEMANLFQEAMFDLGGTVYGITVGLPNMPMVYEADLASLADFATFNAQLDIPPHESETEHDKWLQEPPDYTTSTPDAEDTVTGLDQ